MKFSKILFFLVLSVLVVFSSCKEDEISKDIVTEQPVIPETVTFNPLVANVQASASSEDGLDLGCFMIDFPFSLNFGGVEVLITSEEDFTNALEENAEEEFIDFVYPLNVTYEDGTTVAVADGEELGEAFATCVPDGGWDYEEGDFPAYLICELNSCYQIVYPLNLVDGDGNSYIATSEEEFIELIAENYDLFFEFPVTLLDEDGETVTAGSDEDLFELLASCDQISWPSDTLDWDSGISQFGCYEFGYPISIVGEDGETTVVNDEDAFFNAILNGGFVDFGFPLNLIDEDGQTIVVNDSEELYEALEECEDFVVLDMPIFILYQFATNLELGDCYEILYPLSVVDVQGETLDINTDEEAATALSNGEWFASFPLSISVDGATETLNSVTEFNEVIATCE